jgi:hypothetical protein
MTLLRFGLLLALVIGVGGCAVGGPERASDIQNVNAISDDIAAVGMTRSDTASAHDPNMRSVIPRNYETSYTR